MDYLLEITGSDTAMKLFCEQLYDYIGDIPDGNTNRKSDDYEYILNHIRKMLNTKDSEYIIDPIKILTADDLLTQIKIKATRACLVKSDAKRQDELLDVIVYSMLLLKKLETERKNPRD